MFILNQTGRLLNILFGLYMINPLNNNILYTFTVILWSSIHFRAESLIL